jgi:hypothetical protein
MDVLEPRVVVLDPELRAHRLGDRARDFGLHGEHVGELAVVARGPEVRAVGDANQLRGDRS